MAGLWPLTSDSGVRTPRKSTKHERVVSAQCYSCWGQAEVKRHRAAPGCRVGSWKHGSNYPLLDATLPLLPPEGVWQTGWERALGL